MCGNIWAYAYEHDLCRDSLAIVVDPESDVRIFNFLFFLFFLFWILIIHKTLARIHACFHAEKKQRRSCVLKPESSETNENSNIDEGVDVYEPVDVLEAKSSDTDENSNIDEGVDAFEPVDVVTAADVLEVRSNENSNIDEGVYVYEPVDVPEANSSETDDNFNIDEGVDAFEPVDVVTAAVLEVRSNENSNIDGVIESRNLIGEFGSTSGSVVGKADYVSSVDISSGLSDFSTKRFRLLSK